jgi:hypothetical protein
MLYIHTLKIHPLLHRLGEGENPESKKGKMRRKRETEGQQVFKKRGKYVKKDAENILRPGILFFGLSIL